jgi:hypothetical protein
MERTGEARLEDTLSFLLNEDSGKMDEREVDPGQWGKRAFNTMRSNGWKAK